MDLDAPVSSHNQFKKHCCKQTCNVFGRVMSVIVISSPADIFTYTAAVIRVNFNLIIIMINGYHSID